MDGVAQLASASFLFYFVVSCQSSGPTLGVVTSIYLACLTAVAILSALGAVSDDHLSLDGTALHNNFQIWRVWTCFFWVDGLGIGYALQLWFFGAYSTLVEQHFAGAEIRYVVVLGAGALQILLLTTVIGTGSVLSLAHALCFYVIGLWSRFEQNRSCSFFKLSHVPAASMPWCLLALGIPITGIGNAMYNVVGICAALGYECLIGLTPVPPDTSKPHSQSLHATRRSHNKAGSEPMSRSTSATGRERCIRFGHVAFAMLIAIYNFRNQSVDVRTERSAGVKLCKRMHEAMDATAPRMSQLMSKFAESLSMTADAESIFLVWTFAAEHWQQSLAQKQSQVNVNQMGALDPEVTRQAVVQALRGGEVTEDMSDADVLKEVYRLMGINRLLITADARPYFLTAIASYREQRAHYLLACGQIKRFVLHHEALNVDQSVGDDDIYEAMNTFLTEYDLPGRMSDEAILVELFTLLELPLDAASFKIDEALRDAIRRHRKVHTSTPEVGPHPYVSQYTDSPLCWHFCYRSNELPSLRTLFPKCLSMLSLLCTNARAPLIHHCQQVKYEKRC